MSKQPNQETCVACGMRSAGATSHEMTCPRVVIAVAGTDPAVDITAQLYEAGVAEGVAAERALVVRWLRAMPIEVYVTTPLVCEYVKNIADVIERGEHVKS